MPLEKEFWLPIVKEQYDEEPSFLNAAEDQSANVTNNILHLAEAGVDPTVLYNNTSYPVPVVERADTPIELPLAYFDTENTVVRNAEAVQLVYDKMASVTRRHAAAMKNETAFRATFDYSPNTDSQFTPVIPTTGANRGDGKKRLTENDVLILAQLFDAIAPNKDRSLVLNHKHFYDLLATSEILRGQMMRSGREGVISKQIFELYGFQIWMYNGKAIYNPATGTKLPYGTPLGANSASSFAFVNMEMMKAVGTMDMFDRLRDPEQRGDILGFQHRFVALPYRNKYYAAIYDANE